MQKEKIIVDTDPGIDDAFTIIFLAKSGVFDIKAITTVAGNCSVQKATNNAYFLKQLLSLSVPIFSGSEKPLERELTLANIHGKNGLGSIEVAGNQELDYRAVKKIVEIVRQYPNEVTILAIGPLTNIAKAFKEDPELPNMVKQLVIMGGAIKERGNMNSHKAEFNFFVDPEAAEFVLKSAAKKILVPLDACNQVVLQREDFEVLVENEENHFVKTIVSDYISNLKKIDSIQGAVMYDPLAGHFLFRRDQYKVQPFKLTVKTIQGEEGKVEVNENGYELGVLLEVNKNMFAKDFLDVLKKA